MMVCVCKARHLTKEGIASPMLSVSALSTHLQDLFTATANRLARETGCVQRQVKWTGAVLAQTLVFGWLAKPEARLTDLCHMAATAGLSITPQGLDQRFTPALATYVQRLLQEAVQWVVAADPVAIPLLQRFTGVWLEDCSTLSLPAALAEEWCGCGGSGETSHAALKLSVRLDLLCGSLHGPVLAAGHVQDRVVSQDHPALPANSLRITDLGYFSTETFAALVATDVFVLSRPQARTTAVDADGHVWDIADLLAAQTTNRVDLAIELGAQTRVPCRLLAARVSAETASRRRQAISKDARREGQTPSRSRLLLADWNAYITTAPADKLSLDDALVLARARWQIELLFKLWKSHGKLAHSRSQKPYRILCEIYAKLLALIVQHWILLTAAWRYPDRSLPKLLAVVRDWATTLVDTLHSGRSLSTLVRHIRPCLATAVAINPRRKHPNTYQRLLDPSLEVLH